MEQTLKGSPNWKHRKARGQSEEEDIYISKVIGNIPKGEIHTIIG